MYSPKINETLISPLYHQAKSLGLPMTRLVNEIISEYLSDVDAQAPPEDKTVPMGFYSSDQKGAV